MFFGLDQQGNAVSPLTIPYLNMNALGCNIGKNREAENEMFILKLAALTCAVYMGITLLLFAGLLATAHLKGSIGYMLNWLSMGFLFGLIWLLSFSVAWRIVYFQFMADKFISHGG